MTKILKLFTILIVIVIFWGCATYKKRVVVMDFVNATNLPEYNVIAREAVPEMLLTDLTNWNSLRLLERQDIARYLNEIDNNPNNPTNLTRWQQLGKRMQADYFIAGSVAKLGNVFFINIRIFNVETGKLVPGSGLRKRCVKEDELPGILKEIADKLAIAFKRRSLETISEK